MKEFKVNNYIILKLEGRNTNIYINQNFFNQCKFLLMEIPFTEISKFDEITSIDEAVEVLDRTLEGRDDNVIPPETEFWGHCSNLQVWAENNYDTRLLHSNLAFPLLKKLSEVGDPIANRVFKEEIAKRLKSKSNSVIKYILEEHYLDSFNKEELEAIFYDSMFFNVVEQEKLLDYLISTYLRVELWNLLVIGLTYILERNSKNADILYHLGWIYYKKAIYNEDLDKAIEALEKLLKIRPNNKRAQYELIKLYYNEDQFKNFELVEVIQYINSEEILILNDYICPHCRKVNKTDFIRIKLCSYCNNELSKSGKFERFNFRRSFCGGSWYPNNKVELTYLIEKLFKDEKYGPGKVPNILNTQRTVIGGISPNAGYLYSGYASAHTYFNLFKEKIPDTIIIFGPDLIGLSKVVIMGGGVWDTPLGNISVDSELAFKIFNVCQKTALDDISFISGQLAKDHSIEVQLPLIKYCSKNKNTRIVPMVIPHNVDFEIINKLSLKLARIIKKANKDIICLAVGALSHIEIPDDNVINQYKRLDQDFIKSFKEFDIKSAYSSLLKIPGNGLGSITLLMLISKNLGATQCKSLKYYTSYDLLGSGHYSAAYFSGVLIKNIHEISNNNNLI